MNAGDIPEITIDDDPRYRAFLAGERHWILTPEEIEREAKRQPAETSSDSRATTPTCKVVRWD